MPLAAGTRLGSYEILSLLGAGGMGEVYRGRDWRLGRDVAIKVMPADVARDRARLDDFDERRRRSPRSITPTSLPSSRLKKRQVRVGRVFERLSLDQLHGQEPSRCPLWSIVSELWDAA